MIHGAYPHNMVDPDLPHPHLLIDFPAPITYNEPITGADLDSTPVLNSVVHAEKVTSLVNHLWHIKAIANDDSYALAA